MVDLGYFGTYAKFYYSFYGRPSFDTKHQIQGKSKKEAKMYVDKRLGLSIVILYQTVRIILYMYIALLQEKVTQEKKYIKNLINKQITMSN